MASLLFRSQWRIALAGSRLQSTGGSLQCWQCDRLVDTPSLSVLLKTLQFCFLQPKVIRHMGASLMAKLIGPIGTVNFE